MSKETFLKYGFVVLFHRNFFTSCPKGDRLAPFVPFFGYSFAYCCVFNTREKNELFLKFAHCYRPAFFYPTTIRSTFWSCQFIDWFTSGNS